MVLSRRGALTAAAVGAGLAVLSPNAAASPVRVSPTRSWARDRTLSAGRTDREELFAAHPDQVVTVSWSSDLSSAGAGVYLTAFARENPAGACVKATLAHERGRARLRLIEHGQDGADTVVAASSSVQSPAGETRMTLRLVVVGGRATARVAELGLSAAAGTSVADGTRAGHVLYLGRSASAPLVLGDVATEVRCVGRRSPRAFGALVFADEFSSGTDVSPEKWVDLDPDGDLGYLSYDWGIVTRDTHDVSDGCLHVRWRAREEPWTGYLNKYDAAAGMSRSVRAYDEAYLLTRGRFSMVYGRVEARVRFPQAVQGQWGGVWMRPDHDLDDGFPNGGEIDIAESFGGGDATGHLSATVHWSQVRSDHDTREAPPARLDDWHVYAVEKTPERITFFMDGRAYHEVLRADRPADFDRCFGPHAPYHLRLNAQSGCQWWSGRIPTGAFDEASMDIDYVRVRKMA